MSLGTFVLFLHVTVAIVGFGVTYGFPIMFSMAAKEPEHSNFALRVSDVIERKMMTPLFVAMPFLGLWLIYLRDWDLWASEWLVISIVIYIAAFFYGTFVQAGVGRRMIELTKGQPTPEQAQELERLAKRSRLGGMFLGLAVIVIALLMVWKPGGEAVL